MELFDLPKKETISKSLLTCKSCKHRQSWQCSSKVFQYCGARKSNRTTNGLLKIKCKTEACPLHSFLEKDTTKNDLNEKQ